MGRRVDFGAEPTAADLAAIEAEWPLIGAGLAVLDAQIIALNDAGARLYLTIRIAAGQSGTSAQPPRRPAAPPQLTAREDS